MERLIKALRIIRQECIHHIKCNECPMGDPNTSGCYLIHYQPANWDIKEVDDVTKIFKVREG